jgi:hypothetical protein
VIRVIPSFCGRFVCLCTRDSVRKARIFASQVRNIAISVANGALEDQVSMSKGAVLVTQSLVIGLQPMILVPRLTQHAFDGCMA